MGLFSKKKKDGDANPYAQEVPFSNPMTPYQQARNNMAKGDSVGLSGPNMMGSGASNTPPPSYRSPSIASSNTRYGDEKYGNQNGYGADRYGSGPTPARGQGGYGGFDDAAGKNDLFGGAAARPGPPAPGNVNGGPPPPPGDNRNPALFGNAQDRYNPYGAAQQQQGGADAGDEYGGYGAPRELTEEEREEQEVQAIKDETKATRNAGIESLKRTRAMQAQGLDQMFATQMRLAQQEERLQNTEQKLDMATIYAKDGTDKTKTLDKLNRTPFFIPAEMSSKKSRAKQIEATMERHREERETREATRRDGFSEQQRMEETTKQAARAKPGTLGAGKAAKSNKWAFEEDDEDNAQEEEINDLLEETAQGASQLNTLAGFMGEGIGRSIQRLDRIGNKTDLVDDNVRKNRAMLGQIR